LIRPAETERQFADILLHSNSDPEAQYGINITDRCQFSQMLFCFIEEMREMASEVHKDFHKQNRLPCNNSSDMVNIPNQQCTDACLSNQEEAADREEIVSDTSAP